MKIEKYFIIGFFCLFVLTASAYTKYYIEHSHNDELFIINGEKFEAKTYCFGMEDGDPVVFLDGSPYGACASATILNLRTKNECECWCE
ncbi:MAG: hypothetical protein PHC58_05575 [Candidatus Omnitrophica bacterium]|nr:hypothetical protein [Candidatus Omnitrophota bacterium]